MTDSKETTVALIDGKPVVLDKTIGDRQIRSGQTQASAFFDSVVASYTNLTYSPVITLLFSFFGVCVAAEACGLNFLDVIQKNLTALAKTDNKMLANIFSLLIKVISTVTDFRIYIYLSFFIFLPWMKKPSSKNLKFSIVFEVLMFLFTNSSDLIFVFALTQLWFLYTELRSPKYKFFVFMVAVVIFAVAIPIANEKPTEVKTPNVQMQADAPVPDRAPRDFTPPKDIADGKYPEINKKIHEANQRNGPPQIIKKELPK